MTRLASGTRALMVVLRIRRRPPEGGSGCATLSASRLYRTRPQPLPDLESNRHLNPNLDPVVPVQSRRKSENVCDLEGRLVELHLT